MSEYVAYSDIEIHVFSSHRYINTLFPPKGGNITAESYENMFNKPQLTLDIVILESKSLQLITTIHHVSVVRHKLNIACVVLLRHPLGLGPEDLRKRLAVILRVGNANHRKRLGEGHRQELKHHDTIMIYFCSDCMYTKTPANGGGLWELQYLWF